MRILLTGYENKCVHIKFKEKGYDEKGHIPFLIDKPVCQVVESAIDEFSILEFIHWLSGRVH